MTNISSALGVTRFGEDSGWAGMPIEYPHKRFDLIWVVPQPYTEILRVESEQVPGLDDGKTPDPPGNSARRSRNVSPQLVLLMTLNVVYLLVSEVLEWQC